MLKKYIFLLKSLTHDNYKNKYISVCKEKWLFSKSLHFISVLSMRNIWDVKEISFVILFSYGKLQAKFIIFLRSRWRKMLKCKCRPFLTANLRDKMSGDTFRVPSAHRGPCRGTTLGILKTSILTPRHNRSAHQRDRNSNEQAPPPDLDKTTWVLVKDELWLFLETEVLSVATGRTLNSCGWNYLKRRDWLMHLGLVIVEVLCSRVS